jgi:hypothetical protein
MTNEELLDKFEENCTFSGQSEEAQAEENYRNYRSEILSRMGQPAGMPPQVDAIRQIVEDPDRKVEYGTPEYFLLQRLRAALIAPPATPQVEEVIAREIWDSLAENKMLPEKRNALMKMVWMQNIIAILRKHGVVK